MHSINFSIPNPSGMIAFLLIVFAVPIYAVSSFDGTTAISISRWLALYLIATEAAIAMIALFSGWRPIESWKRIPIYVRIALTLWLVVASIATVSSSDVVFSSIFQIFWVVHGIFAWALWAMLTTSWSAWARPLLVYFSIGLLLHSLLVYFVAWILLGPELPDWEKHMVGTTNPRLYTFYAATMLGLGLGFLLTARIRSVWLLAVVLTFAAYHLFAWSGGRASFATSLIVPILVMAFARRKWRRVILVCIPCAIIAFPLSLFTAPANDIYGFKSVMGRIGTNALDNEYTSNRFDIWRNMLEQSAEKPVFGHGQIGTLDLIVDMPEGAALNAHNAIVHIIHAWGGLGLLVFAIGVLPFLPTIRMRLEAMPTVAWPAFVSLLALSVTSVLDGTLFYNQPLFFVALFIAILGSVTIGQPKGGRSPTERHN